MQNNAVIVKEGGWKQLPHAIFTDNLGSIPNFPVSHFTRPDGTSISSITGTVIETYPIGFPNWDPTKVGSIIDTFTITFDATPIGHCLNDDGTELYVVGQATKRLYQVNVPIPYKQSSIVPSSEVSIDLSFITNDVLQVFISRDEDFIFITDGTSLYSLPLPIKGDITSFVLSTQTVFAPGGGVNVDSVAIKREGDKFSIGDTINNILREYETTAPNIIVGATANGNTLVLTGDPIIHHTFRSNGLEILILDDLGGLKRCHADEEWDLSTASLNTNTFGVPLFTQSTFWKPDETKFFNLISSPSDRIDEITVPNRGNITGGSITAQFSLIGIADTPRGLYVSPEGETANVVDNAIDSVVQLDMTMGWDATTMSAPGITFDLNAAIPSLANPTGISWSKNQLTYYISDAGVDDIFQLTVPAPLDIENSVDTGNVLDLSSFGDVTDIQIKPDDKLMFVSVRNVDRILLFRLPADGNVSNAVFLIDLNVEDVEDNLQGFFISENNGKKLWLVGLESGFISCMNMTLEFNNTITTNFGEELTTDIGEPIVYA